MALTVGSLFSGIGGIDLGLERAGMVVKWQIEIDPYAQKVLAKHWPDVARFRDVRECGAANLEPVDVIAGGFPCQDISNAGTGAGLAGTRSGLWREFSRLVGELRPGYVIVENVTALLGRGLGDVLGDLAAFGYDAEWECLPAGAFGAAHIRDRVFVVAYTHGQRRQKLNSTAVPAILGQHTGIPFEAGHYWRTQPMPDRVANGVPYRVDRLRGLGNAVVPQVAQFVGECIVAAQVKEEVAA
jgi:DNA (cytosine-5)-methyltransferase 1